jgi:UDP-2-acetamido-2,6-beta-L-arabino-hexul-4-ose reductase
MKIGITGGKGFIAKNLKEKLTKHEIIEFEGNVKNIVEVQKLYSVADKVVHLAGKNKGDDEELFITNVLGCYNILQCAEATKKQTIIAGTTYSKKNAYSASKNISDTLIKQMQKHGIKVINYKIPNVVGVGIKPFYNSFVATLCYLMAKGEEYEALINDPSDSVTLIDVNVLTKDMVDCLEDESHMLFYMNMLDGERWFSGDETFNITIGEIVDILKSGSLSSHPKKQLFLDMERYYTNYAKDK